MSTSHTENTVNDYNSAFGSQPETNKTHLGGALAMAALVAAVGYVASRPRVRRAIKELMTPEPQATVNVTAE